MKDWKTTVLGIVVLGSALFGLLESMLPQLFAGHLLEAFASIGTHWDKVVTALAGLGLVFAKDATP